MAKLEPIRTPMNVRWQRIQNGLLPLLAVVLCALLAAQLWRESPHGTSVGQVNAETAAARTPVGGTLADLPGGKSLRLFDEVQVGQVVARVENENGKWTDILSPISGQVTEIHRQPGEPVKNGQAILTIAANHGHLVTAYVRASDSAQPEPGMAVEVRLKARSSKTLRGTVERIGPQYERIPAAQLRGRKDQDWGLPVIISLPPDAEVKPGELVYIGWSGGTTHEPTDNEDKDDSAEGPAQRG